MDFFARVESLKSDWRQQSLYRELKKSNGIDFCSNDYLGLSQNKELQERLQTQISKSGLGSTGSRLLRGHSQSLEELEKNISEFCGSESALFFPSGYQANLGLFSSLLKDQATVFSDEQIHASIIDGIRLSGCEKYIFSHNSLQDLEMLLKRKAKPDRLNVVVTESVFSMSGQLSPLSEMQTLCETYGAYLVVDEAHATGLFGKNGSGRVEEVGLRDKVLATIHTAGKALGVSGAWIAGSQSLIEFMINRSRPFIYTTAPAHYQQVALAEALNFFRTSCQKLTPQYKSSQERFQSDLQKLAQDFSLHLEGLGGPVTSLMVYENEKSLALMNALAEKGFDVRAIRPPTVPEGKAQLRIIKPLNRSIDEVQNFLRALRDSLGEIQ